MKRLIFILLKIAEVSLLPIAYVLFGYIGWFIFAYARYFQGEALDINKHNFGFKYFFLGLLCSVFIYGIIQIAILTAPLVPDLFKIWIYSNKKWSQNIVNWLKRNK